MSEQPITREQAIKALQKWRDSWPDGIRRGEAFAAPEWNVHEVCDFLLRELEEKKAPDPDPYGHDLFLGIRSHIENGRLDPRKPGDRDIIMLAIEESWTELRLDRELDQRADAEKKAVEPVSYGALYKWLECEEESIPNYAAAVLRVVETQIEPDLQLRANTEFLSDHEGHTHHQRDARTLLAALAQARRPTT